MYIYIFMKREFPLNDPEAHETDQSENTWYNVHFELNINIHVSQKSGFAEVS